jgi:hypothetical protein
VERRRRSGTETEIGGSGQGEPVVVCLSKRTVVEGVSHCFGWASVSFDSSRNRFYWTGVFAFHRELLSF